MTRTDQQGTERPPVVAVLGHIDHGKSTLLDYIRKTNITEKEAGGITQHIAAYEVLHKTPAGGTKKITFLDTPGHEAFGRMRARGAELADVAILVISAEDSVKAQTLEALKAILDAGIPFIVAATKIDKPNANIEKVKQELSERNVFVEGYGGDVPFIPVSSKSGEGIPLLLDMILLVAELKELRGDRARAAEGVVLESSLDPKTGISATLVIQNGALRTGMFVVAGDAWSPVRRIQNFLRETVKEAAFSSPVRITGWNTAPEVGSRFSSFETRAEALEVAAADAEGRKQAASEKPLHPDTKEERQEGRVRAIPLIIKADTAGSLEAIEHEVRKIQIPNMEIKTVYRGIGNITEGDIKALARAEYALVAGFHVATADDARRVAEEAKIPIGTFSIIYELADWLTEEVRKRAPKVAVEETTGTAKIIRIFSQTKDTYVLGGKVATGKLVSGSSVKILRRGIEVGRGKILELQQQKVKTGTVAEGSEFGALIQSKQAVAAGDSIECFTIVET